MTGQVLCSGSRIKAGVSPWSQEQSSFSSALLFLMAAPSCKVTISERAQPSCPAGSLAGMEGCLPGHEHLHQFSPVHQG